jgi:HEAT repeat protein
LSKLTAAAGVLALLVGRGAAVAQPPKGTVKAERLANLRKSLHDFQIQRDAFSEKANQQVLTTNKIGSAAADLIAALGHPDVTVRQAAAFVLGKRGETSAIPRLKTVLADGDPVARLAAARSLLQLGDAAGLDAVVREARSQDTTMRGAAVGLLPDFGRSDDQKARVFEVLSEALADPVREVRLAAAAGVLLSEQPGAAQALRKAREKEADAAVRGILDEYLNWLDP